MSSLDKARQDPTEQLWDEIDGVHAVMLGLEAENGHLQPMAPQLDRSTSTVWFYTKSDSDLAQHVGSGSRASLIVVGKDHDYHASLSGRIEVRNDKAKIDQFWNSVVAAWYEGGKDDPKLTMLALQLEEGEIWASTGSTLKFGWEIAKANLDDSKVPDVGVKRHLVFERRAA